MGCVKELLFDQLEQIDQMPLDSLEFPSDTPLVVAQRKVNTKHYRQPHPEKRSDVIDQFLSKLKIS